MFPDPPSSTTPNFLLFHRSGTREWQRTSAPRAQQLLRSYDPFQVLEAHLDTLGKPEGYAKEWLVVPTDGSAAKQFLVKPREGYEVVSV